MPRILISAAHKSSGKTTLSIGLCAALAQRGLSVQPFKKGPDYIDPMWLGRAAQSSCYNLDFYTMTQDEITNKFTTYSHNTDISLIEGNTQRFLVVALLSCNSMFAAKCSELNKKQEERQEPS